VRIIKSIQEMIKYRKSLGSQASIGFVPTMGGLHDGHFTLIETSLSENEITIASIFLNPTQFNNPNDLKTYPSNMSEDFGSLEELGVDIVFTPSFDDIYPDGYHYKVSENDFSNELCGAHRPGHFDGVLSIVMKLFNITQPTRSYFGEKDFQQLKLIKGMVTAFFIDTTIVPIPTVREKDGLALSSRNRNLSDEARNLAPKIYGALVGSASAAEASEKISQLGFDVDYVVDKGERRFAAASIENVRLIDNVDISGDQP